MFLHRSILFMLPQIAALALTAAIVWGPRYITFVGGTIVCFILAFLTFIIGLDLMAESARVRPYVSSNWESVRQYLEEPNAHKQWNKYAESARATFLVSCPSILRS